MCWASSRTCCWQSRAACTDHTCLGKRRASETKKTQTKKRTQLVATGVHVTILTDGRKVERHCHVGTGKDIRDRNDQGHQEAQQSEHGHSQQHQQQGHPLQNNTLFFLFPSNALCVVLRRRMSLQLRAKDEGGRQQHC